MKLARIVPVLVLLIAPAAMVAPSTAAPAAPALDPGVVDEAWLLATHAELAARWPHFLDVGYAALPSVHVGVLFNGPVPADLGSVHGALATVGYDVSSAIPVTHEPIVPVMLLAAQQVPSGIGPGVWMLAPHACTMAHVVKDAANRLYVMTAGHCVDFVGQRVSLVAEGDIGRVVAFENAGPGRDYALVAIDPQHYGKVDPSMVGWAGPVGVATAPETTPVKHYGFGAATWYTHASRCRAGATSETWWGAASFGFDGVILWGDSGSASNTGDGKALGINTHLNPVLVSGNTLGTRTTWAMARLSAMSGQSLTLVDGEPVRAACDVVSG